MQEGLAEVLELRAADPQQRAMLEDYLHDTPLPREGRVLEIGCGTGPVSRFIAGRPEVHEVIGIDPSPVFIEHARAKAVPKTEYLTGDGRELPFEDRDFDAVVCHTSLCHIPEPGAVLAEARRVTKEEEGLIAVFDGDYATTTVAICDSDPLQACADAAIEALVFDRFFVRRLPALMQEAGWSVVRVRSHGYVETSDPVYMLTIVDRGADVLVDAGAVGRSAADALKAEARRRVADGRFFGHIAYASAIGTRRADA